MKFMKLADGSFYKFHKKLSLVLNPLYVNMCADTRTSLMACKKSGYRGCNQKSYRDLFWISRGFFAGLPNSDPE